MVRAEALAPADDGDEHDQRLQRERAGEVEGLRLAGRNGQRRQRVAGVAQERPGDEEREPRRRDRVGDRPVSAARAAARERRDRDERGAEHAADEVRPLLRGAGGMAAELRADAEPGRRERGDEEAAREQEVDAPALGREAGGRQQGDEQPGERHRGLQHEPELRQVEPRPHARVREEERENRAEQAREQGFAEEPGLEVVLFFHFPLVGRTAAADKRSR